MATSKQIREFDYGSLAGSQNKKLFKDWTKTSGFFIRDPETKKVIDIDRDKKFPDGDSTNDVLRRVTEFFDGLIEHHMIGNRS